MDSQSRTRKQAAEYTMEESIISCSKEIQDRNRRQESWC